MAPKNNQLARSLMLQFSCLTLSTTHTRPFHPSNVVIAGWTGRNTEAIEHHIEELAAIGVPRPSTVPLYYRVGISCLSQAKSIQVVGDNTSGEAEPVLVAMADGLWLTVGSDHTDRSAETYSVALSKQLCPKVIADQAWRFDEIKGHADQILLRSWIVEINPANDSDLGPKVLYQDGTLGAIRPLESLIAGYEKLVHQSNSKKPGLGLGTLMSCGTVGAIGGIRPAKRFIMQLFDPVLGRTLEYDYAIETLPLVS
jgi:Protein of unknown function (DUF2848)